MTSEAIHIPSPIGPAQESQLAAFESFHNISLPDEYRVFLRNVNGCILSRQLLPFDNWGDPDETMLACLRGIHDYVVPDGIDGMFFRNVEYIAGQYVSDDCPSDQLLVIADDGSGNELVMQIGDVSTGTIYLFEHETQHLCPVANSFAALLKCLRSVPLDDPLCTNVSEYPRIKLQPAPSIPLCPECSKMLRTSASKQCFDCGADWH